MLKHFLPFFSVVLIVFGIGTAFTAPSEAAFDLSNGVCYNGNYYFPSVNSSLSYSDNYFIYLRSSDNVFALVTYLTVDPSKSYFYISGSTVTWRTTNNSGFKRFTISSSWGWSALKTENYPYFSQTGGTSFADFRVIYSS